LTWLLQEGACRAVHTYVYLGDMGPLPGTQVEVYDDYNYISMGSTRYDIKYIYIFIVLYLLLLIIPNDNFFSSISSYLYEFI
jgi:hypothetical protein